MPLQEDRPDAVPCQAVVRDEAGPIRTRQRIVVADGMRRILIPDNRRAASRTVETQHVQRGIEPSDVGRGCVVEIGVGAGLSHGDRPVEIPAQRPGSPNAQFGRAAVVPGSFDDAQNGRRQAVAVTGVDRSPLSHEGARGHRVRVRRAYPDDIARNAEPLGHGCANPRSEGGRHREDVERHHQDMRVAMADRDGMGGRSLPGTRDPARFFRAPMEARQFDAVRGRRVRPGRTDEQLTRGGGRRMGYRGPC